MTLPQKELPVTPRPQAAIHLAPSLPSGEDAMSRPPLCELRRISVRYGERLASDDVSLAIRAGEVVALLGENGAGKSTLLHALYGLVPVDSGEVRYGEALAQPSPERAIAAGIGLVSQHFLLVPRLTVAENIILGKEPRRAGLFGRLGLVDRKKAEDEVAELGRRYGLAVDPRRPVCELSVGEAQRVEILKTLYRGARCLLLDEPTAVLTPQEARRMLGVLRGLVTGSAESGAGAQARPKNGLVIVTHKLDEVMEVADRAVILRGGRVVAEYPRAAFSAQKMAHALVGHEVTRVVREAAPEIAASAKKADAALSVHKLWVVHDGVERVRGVSLELRPGSILGIGGVEGNGQRELCAAICGLLRPASGEVRLDGRDVTATSVRERRAAGLSFVLEDRQRHGLVLDFSLAENLLLGEPELGRYRRQGFIERRRLVADAKRLLALHDVRPADLSLPARALSGGNQQKLLIARAIGLPERLPRVLLVAQPTRGVDIGAIAAIHRTLLETRDRGCAILLVSTELDELRALCDRIAVLYRGEVLAELPNPAAAPVSRERLGELLAGVGHGGSPE
jgi:simple sugar transport system ATP-binding protein